MIFLSVGFLERALNKGRGSEGYIITATCIPKDIYESCSTSSWWSCWLVLPETSKNKKVILLCLWSYFINQLMECKTNDPNFTSLNEEGTLSANKMKSLSFFFIQTVIFFWHLYVHCTVSHTDAQYIFRLIIWLQKKFPIKVCWRPINAHKFCNPRWNLL